MGTKYISKQPDDKGIIHYTDGENSTWQTLYTRQWDIVQDRACAEFLDGLEQLQLPQDRVPQLGEVNKKLAGLTGWSVAKVPALINYQRFFDLLANRQFPAATFIRIPEELDYLEEPDVFHEIFGHCPLLANPVYADFMHAYGKIAAKADAKQQVWLARLYWFTVEFGLINTPQGVRVYGGGILSSIGETPYCLESDTPQRKPFDIIEALRTPYRIDIMQLIYFVINDLSELYQLTQMDLLAQVAKAKQLGKFAPVYPPKDDDKERSAC